MGPGLDAARGSFRSAEAEGDFGLNGKVTTRLWLVPLDSDLPSGSVLALIRDQPLPFALTGSWAGSEAILGSEPLATTGPADDPFETWDRLPTLEDEETGDAVGGGWFGWLGYGAGARVEKLPPQPPRPAPLPEWHLAYYDNVLRRDRGGRWWFEALLTPARRAALEERLAGLRELLGGASGTDHQKLPDPPERFRLVPPGADGHVAAVARCRERIRSGEFFQANLRVRLEAEWPGDLASLFPVASGETKPAFGAVFPTPTGGILSLSPELFLRRRGHLVETAPIKGTARRGGEVADDEAARVALASSAKDAAEHVMIVDVARNDLGRVCRPGTVQATSKPEVRAHPGLWHLVSTVRGQLHPAAGNAELLRATFPPCSVTGAPKVQSMKAIAGLEPLGREVFTGAIGFSSPAAGLEMSVAIRTFEAGRGRIWLDVGGGIVSDSDPRGELEECLDKARPLIDAIGSTISIDLEMLRTGREPGDLPWAPDKDQHRPDPAAGLLETIRIDANRPVEVDRHLARLEASLAEVFMLPLPAGLSQRINGAARQPGCQALRVRVRPDGSVRIERRKVSPRVLPVPLRPIVLPGGLGAHKWADRRMLDDLSTVGPTPLLLDADGAVLECAWGNVWIARGDELLTPPADGRILPGVMRDVLLEAGLWDGRPVREAPLFLEELVSAERILVSSSLAGLVEAVLAV